MPNPRYEYEETADEEGNPESRIDPDTGWEDDTRDDYVPPTTTTPPASTPEPTQTGNSCFPAGTLVETPDGPRPIEELRVGDEVVADTSGSHATVTALHTRSVPSVLRIMLSDGTQIETTEEHPFWSVDAHAFVRAADLGGAHLLRDTGTVVDVEDIVYEPYGRIVYNLTVEPYHTYFAGGLWVHNKVYATPPAPTPTPTPAPGNRTSGYTPPMITPSGGVPPGNPYNPEIYRMQNEALKRALTEQAIRPVDPELAALQKQVVGHLRTEMDSPLSPWMAQEDELISRFLTQPTFGDDYTNRLNEQQKELQLARQQQAERQILQRGANRGVLGGGSIQSGLRRAGDETTRNLLESQRSIAMQVEEANRKGFEAGLSLSNLMGETRRNAMLQRLGAGADISSQFVNQAFQSDAANRDSLLNALGISEGILGGREGRQLDMGRFMEGIRQFDQGLLNRQAEFRSGQGFNYDSLNSNNYNSWLSYLARLAGR